VTSATFIGRFVQSKRESPHPTRCSGFQTENRVRAACDTS
jgi:hypothetical protein